MKREFKYQLSSLICLFSREDEQIGSSQSVTQRTQSIPLTCSVLKQQGQSSHFPFRETAMYNMEKEEKGW